MVIEHLVCKFKVTEWKGGSIYKTQEVGEVWVPSSTPMYKPDADGFFYTSLSTKRMKEVNYNTFRTVKG